MKRVMRWRYYCDFCKKSSGGSLKVHEASCTLNPERKCRMCKLLFPRKYRHGVEQGQHPMAELIAALVQGGVEAVKELSGDCPACILAAIRQHKATINPMAFESETIEDWPGQNYPYAEEMKAALQRANEAMEYENAY